MQPSRRCLLGLVAISALASGTPGFAQQSNKPNNGVAAEEVGSAPPSPGACPAAAATGFADPMSVPHWNGWGVDSSQRRFQSGETAQLAAEDVPRLKLKWAFGFPGANFAFAQPTMMGGRVFVGSEGGKVWRTLYLGLLSSSGATLIHEG